MYHIHYALNLGYYHCEWSVSFFISAIYNFSSQITVATCLPFFFKVFFYYYLWLNEATLKQLLIKSSVSCLLSRRFLFNTKDFSIEIITFNLYLSDLSALRFLAILIYIDLRTRQVHNKLTISSADDLSRKSLKIRSEIIKNRFNLYNWLKFRKKQ